jgi:uncharacterized protein YjbI with pentapeptide repeats
VDWTDCEFVGRDFRDDDLSRLRTERVVFTECDFSGVNLAESEHLGSAFRNCTFKLTALWQSTFRQCSMLGSVFERCRMRPLTLDEVDFTLAVLGGNDLRGVDLSGCRLRETSLVQTDLRGAVADPSLWTTASLTRARVDIAQALAYAAAHGLRMDSERDR